MKKITLVAALLATTIAVNAQDVVKTVFGSVANEAIAEWDGGTTFNQFLPEEQPDNGKIQTKTSATLGTASYIGTYGRTLLSTDVILFKVRHVDSDPSANDLTKVIFSYKQDGGALETQTLALDNTITTVQDLQVTPGFTDGATLSELSISFSNEADTSTFDVLRYTEFLIGEDPALSATKVATIEGATVSGTNGVITVSGANLDAVYSVTGQAVAAEGLASGIYIVKISKDGKQASVKVAL